MIEFVLGGGCFWCLDAVYRQMKGVESVLVGYGGGSGSEPTYYQVASGTTNYAEVACVRFNEIIIPTETILDIFFLIHDPTSLNRQGSDSGPQYRSIMLFKDKQQKTTFEEARSRAQKVWPKPIVTEINPLETLYIAEQEHQDYFNKNPDTGYCRIVITPKIIKARAAYAQWFKKETDK